MTKKSERMYKERKKNIGIIEGCPFGCTYCAFKSLQKRFGTSTEDKEFLPHVHLSRLDIKPPETINEQFVTIGLNGDISATSDEVMFKIIEYCKKWSRTQFLIQSKNPTRFVELNESGDYKFRFPGNTILAATVETNYTVIPHHYYKDGVMDYPYSAISKAPPPTERIEAMAKIKDNRKVITIEPVLDFNLTTFVELIKKVAPFRVYVGYCSNNTKLPEPLLEKTGLLIDELRKFTDVQLKLMREAWYK